MASNTVNSASKPSSYGESLGKFISLYGCNTSSSVYKNASHSGQCVTLNQCNDIKTNPGPPIHIIVLILLKQSRHHINKVILCTLVKMLENNVLL